MNIILLSGGSGTRLWPLSSEQRSKQFIPLFKKDSGGSMSMLQNVWSQLQERNLHRSTIISTSIRQRDQILEQLGREVDLVLEPEKRDTFPAILLSVAYLYSHRGISRDEVVAVMPVDTQVNGSFYDALQQLPKALAETGANVALIGVKPNHPSIKYGYMIPEKSFDESVFTIKEFHEKPSSEEAARFIDQGALWNCGVFCFKAGFLLDMLASLGLPETYEELLLVYSDIEKRSFDYVVVEREKHIAAIAYDGPWKDLGSWCSLVEELDNPITGSGIISDDSQNVHIVNELEIPVAVVGLSDIIVAVSREGILITRKGASAGLKDVLTRIQFNEE
ncbi:MULTISPECIES: sugar phosphate nucleotidyltransferase [unclassified Paenibacillus]|uniref:sugar phosphate nucleotidyltransferase n=1 Tax=unclassified Paenibacillus TaxID=185978 RepID=UPI00363B7116